MKRKNWYDKYIKFYESKIAHSENIRNNFRRKCKEISKYRISIQDEKIIERSYILEKEWEEEINKIDKEIQKFYIEIDKLREKKEYDRQCNKRLKNKPCRKQIKNPKQEEKELKIREYALRDKWIGEGNKKKRKRKLEHSAKRWSTYQQRNEEIKKLGFLSYQEYLKSNLWKKISGKVKKRDDYKCQCCGKERGTQVHHISYSSEVLLGRQLDLLITLCELCHYNIEFDDSDEKILSLHKVNQRLNLFKQSH